MVGRLLSIPKAISKKWLQKGFIKLSGVACFIKTACTTVKQVRVVPKGNHIVIEVLYDKVALDLKPDNLRYCSVDLGLNNLAALGSNVLKPIIINGKSL